MQATRALRVLRFPLQPLGLRSAFSGGGGVGCSPTRHSCVRAMGTGFCYRPLRPLPATLNHLPPLQIAPMVFQYEEEVTGNFFPEFLMRKELEKP